MNVGGLFDGIGLLAFTSPGLSTHGSAKLIPSGELSSNDAGLESASSMMSEQLELLPPPESMPSSVASRARARARRASATVSITRRPGSGERWPEPLASFDLDSLSWRTWRISLDSTTELSGERFSGTWPRSGTTSNGTVYRRQPLAPRTSVTGSSPLLPTPTARAKGGSPVWEGRQGGLILDEAISRLLPTPRANIAKQGLPREKHWGELRAEVMQLLPTPAEADSRNTRNKTANAGNGSTGHKGTTLSDVAYEWSGASTRQQSGDGKRSMDLRLSPWFVEWMLGLPPGWSDPDCPLSATEFKSSSGSWWAAT